MDEEYPKPDSRHAEVPDSSSSNDDVDVDAETEDLIAFLDGELDALGNERIEAKISLDSTVRAEADALKKTWDLLDYLPRSEPSTNFTERTISRIMPLQGSGATSSTGSLAPADSGGNSVAARSASRIDLPVPPPRSTSRKLMISVCWLLAVGASGFGGWFIQGQVKERVSQIDQQEQDARILSESQLLQNLRHYRHVDDLEFIKALDDPDLFGDEQTTPMNEVPK
ncbi:MAG: hypothetical protein K8T89_05475 [Planctomycetes bacterium]|nr:hypothetical protein [Planctomycetota bacterium]